MCAGCSRIKPRNFPVALILHILILRAYPIRKVFCFSCKLEKIVIGLIKTQVANGTFRTKSSTCFLIHIVDVISNLVYNY